MKTTHTPGPWEFCGTGEIRSTKPVKSICRVEDGTEDSRVKLSEYVANSALLAASPDLLDAAYYALKCFTGDRVCYYCHAVDNDGCESDCPAEKLRSAIAKATR